METSFTTREANWQEEEQLIYQIRLTVFVIEQGVSQSIEWDGVDDSCRHAISVSEDGNSIGTGRIKQSGHIGRIAVIKAWRGKGVGTALLNQLINIAKDSQLPKVYLNSQTHASNFYSQHNFIAEGPIFMEAGIPHQRMSLNL